MAKKKSEEPIDPSVVRYIPTTNIDESALNLRTTSWGDLDELAMSMREVGQLTPGLVRRKDDGRYELVIGARRFRACKKEGLAFRAEVAELTEAEAHEIRLIENNQRENPSPLEEAEMFAIALDRHGATVETLAARLARPRSYIQQRLRLLSLVPVVRTLLEEERIEVASAMLLAQLDTDAQTKAAESLTRYRNESESFISRSDVADAIDSSSRELERAPFDTDDAELVAAAGPCSTCPHRTGRQGVLFGVTERDVCLNVPCFVSKSDANWVRESDAARNDGIEVLEGAQAQAALNYGSQYRSLNDIVVYRARDGSGFTDRAYDKNGLQNIEVHAHEVLFGDDAKPVAIARHPQSGAVIELVLRELVDGAVEAVLGVDANTSAGSKGGKSKSSSNGVLSYDDERAEEEKARTKQKLDVEIEGEARDRAIAALVAAVEAGPGDKHLLRAFATALAAIMWSETTAAVIRRRGWGQDDEQGKRLFPSEVLARELADMTNEQISGVLVELIATRSYSASNQGAYRALMESKNVDLKHHKNEATKAAKERAKEKREREKKATKKRAAKEADAEAAE